MPFARPTLSDLQQQVSQDLSSSVLGSGSYLRFSNLGITGKAQAGLAHLHYGYLDWISKQAVPYTATGEFLEAWAALKGVTRKPAAQAGAATHGQVTFTGADGVVIPSGTPLVRADGVEYTSIGDAMVSSGSVAVLAMANPDASGTLGAFGNCDTGTSMSLGTAIAGIQSTGTVSVAFTGGADLETDDALRSRMLQAYQQVPQGGAIADYERWASQVPGVTRAWCSPNIFGAGTVVVYTMWDSAESAHNGFPQGSDGVSSHDARATAATGDQLLVADAIWPLQPVTALVYSVAPAPQTVNFTISGIASASSTTKALIKAAIDGVFFLNGTPKGGTIALSLIESAIAAIAGTTGFVITSPSGNITMTAGDLPVTGTITYT